MFKFHQTITASFLADQRQELFCHEPLTGNIRRSDADSDGVFQKPVMLMKKFCEVRCQTHNQLKFLFLYMTFTF